jgi:hypothetical protein
VELLLPGVPSRAALVGVFPDVERAHLVDDADHGIVRQFQAQERPAPWRA